MIDLLDGLLAGFELKKLVNNPDKWQTKHVDYEEPVVDRLWLQYDKDTRLYLHKIYPTEKALFHPHPWPSAVVLLSGLYEMGIGTLELTSDKVDVWPKCRTKIFLHPGSGYEMLTPEEWHYVKPIGEPSYSIMVSGRPFEKKCTKPKVAQRELTYEEKLRTISVFQALL